MFAAEGLSFCPIEKFRNSKIKTNFIQLKKDFDEHQWLKGWNI